MGAIRIGWQSGICNHFSLAVGQNGNAPTGILINPQGYHWSELTASSLLLMNYESEVIESEDFIEPTAFFIHMAIHTEYQQRNACYMLTRLTQQQ
jgi:ribulose-5-phosphate 4-epimerase/fuculose-1-phosphate aldolase